MSKKVNGQNMSEYGGIYTLHPTYFFQIIFFSLKVQLETKLQALDGIEVEWRAALERGHGSGSGTPSAGSTYYPAYSSWLSFGASYITTILENLQASHLGD